MPRRRRDEAVTERANQILDEQAQRRREAAQRGAQTRRQRRTQQQSEAQPQAAPERPTQAPTTRRSRRRAHGGMVTVAMRGPFADRMREMAESYGMSLSKLLKDALLAYEGQVAAGYGPGTRLAEWSAQQAEASADA